jgi:hypothetical protein
MSRNSSCFGLTESAERKTILPTVIGRNGVSAIKRVSRTTAYFFEDEWQENKRRPGARSNGTLGMGLSKLNGMNQNQTDVPAVSSSFLCGEKLDRTRGQGKTCPFPGLPASFHEQIRAVY